MDPPHRIRFRLALRADEYLAYYRGSAREVVVRAEDGRRVRFPANVLQPFVTHDGVHGRFELQFDAQHKLLGLQRLED